MELSNRIKIIISENGLKQKEFAKSINVTESYISKLLRNESGLSNSTANLIEERYGYSVNWILNGIEPKMTRRNKTKDLTPIQRKLISDIEQMDTAELIALKAFITSLEEYKKAFNNDKITNIKLVSRGGETTTSIGKSQLQEALQNDMASDDSNSTDLF